MPEISELLLRFEKILGGQRNQKHIIIEIVKDKINISLNTDSITLKNGVVFFKVKPIIKNEILFKKDELLMEIKKEIPGLVVEDIR